MVSDVRIVVLEAEVEAIRERVFFHSRRLARKQKELNDCIEALKKQKELERDKNKSND